MEEITRVKFYMSKPTEEFDSEVYAIFPDGILTGNSNLFNGYAHIGQHGQYHIDYIKESTVATKEQYQDLYNELTNLVGYNLIILN